VTPLPGTPGAAALGRRGSLDGGAAAPLPEIITFGEHERPAVIPRWMLLVFLVVGQALFARYMTQLPVIGMLQAVVVLGLSAYSLMRRDILLALLVIAYLPGAEIAWRQAKVPIPYLFAPYLTVALALAMTFLVIGKINRSGRTAVFYIALLTPSILVTVATNPGNSREAVAFGLNGPATLAAMVVLLSQIKIEPWFYKRLLWVLTIGCVAPLAIAVTAISDYVARGQSIDFGSESNFVASGGFGPVQVSSVLGLTALAAILLVMAESQLVPRVLAGVLAFGFTAQSFLTFSRGGMFATGLALGALAVSQANTQEGRRRVGVVVLVAFAIGYFVVVPQVDEFTNGAFRTRFEDTTSGRTNLAANDVAIFKRNLAFGVGPGMSRYQRLSYEICALRKDSCQLEGSSHTEFTRMLSEHGLVGLGALSVFLALALQALRRSGPSRSTSVTFMVWAIAQMFYANMRVVAVGLAFSFSFLRVEPLPDPDPPPGLGDGSDAVTAPTR
jgi:O-antigen ligase